MIIIFIVLLFNSWIVKVFSDEIIKLNYNSTVFEQETIDKRLKELERISLEIELNSINLMLSKNYREELFDSKYIFDFINNIKNYKIANSFLKNIYIYYPGTDYVVGNIGKFKSRQYYLLLNNLKYEGYEKWLDHFKNPFNFFSSTKENEIILYYCHYIPFSKEAERKAILIAEIDENEIKNTLNMIIAGSNSNLLAILDSKDNVYTYAGNEKLLETISKLTKGNTIVKGGKYYADNRLVIVRMSKYGALKYIKVNHMGDILKKVNNIKHFTYLCLFFCLIIGVLFAVYISKRNNMPVASIVKSLSGNLNPKAQSKLDEYDFIQNTINAMIKSNKQAIEKLERQQLIIKQSFLSRIIRGEQKNEQMVFAIAQRYGVDFDFPYFCTLVVCPEKAAVSNKKHSTLLSVCYSFAIRWEKQYSESNIVVTDIKSTYVFLINTEIESYYKKVKELAYSLACALKNAINEDLYIGIGKIYDNMSSIATSYNEALKAIEQIGNYNGGKSAIISYRDILEEDKTNINKRNSLIIKFQSLIEAKEYIEAKEFVPSLFKCYINEDEAAGIKKRKKYLIINEVLKAVDSVYEEYNKPDRDYCYNLIFSGDLLKKLENKIMDVFDRIIDITNESTNKKDFDVAHRAKEIIDNSYADSMLGLYYISDSLGVSSSYISKVFKKKTGMGVVKYINSIRIGKAKELIIKGEMSIKDIALSVGYSSDINFIRVFKKYEQITPGKYKKDNNK